MNRGMAKVKKVYTGTLKNEHESARRGEGEAEDGKEREKSLQCDIKKLSIT